MVILFSYFIGNIFYRFFLGHCHHILLGLLAIPLPCAGYELQDFPIGGRGGSVW